MKRQPIECEKIVANLINDKGFIPKINKEFLKLNSNKIKQKTNKIIKK